MFFHNHIHFDTISSTNDFVLSLKETKAFIEGLVVSSDYQFKGRGQRKKIWESKCKENLLLSILIEPKIPIFKQFDISKYVALALYDLLVLFKLDVKIKWPNDVIVGSKKIGGVLIQNSVSKNIITHSIIGVGLNINQQKFKKYIPEATSLKLELKNTQDIDFVKNSFLKCLKKRIIEYRLGECQENEYTKSLFLLDDIASFESSGNVFEGIIRGVTKEGLLIIQIGEKYQRFNLNEVSFLF